MNSTEAVTATTRKALKISAKIKRNLDGRYEFKCSHTAPAFDDIVNALPAKLKTVARNHGYYRGCNQQLVMDATRGSIKVKEWAKACVDVIRQRESTPDEATIEHAIVGQPAFLALGSVVYRLDPVEYIEKTPRALATLTAQVLSEAKHEAAIFLNEAQTDARELIDRAREELSTIVNSTIGAQARLDELQRQCSVIPALWMLNGSTPMRINALGSRLELGFTLSFAIRCFRSVLAYVEALRIPPVPIPMWVTVNPVTGEYVASSARCEGNIVLPHVSSYACMTVGDAPARINNAQHLLSFKRSLERVFAEVNADSLLTDPESWPATVRAFMPEPLSRMAESHQLVYCLHRPSPTLEPLVHRFAPTEEATTFHIENPPPDPQF